VFFVFSPCIPGKGEFNSARVGRLTGCQFNRSNESHNIERTMAKALSKSQIATVLAEQNQITKKQASQILDSLAELACKQAKNTFTLPGIGKLVLVNRPSRTMVMQFGPDKGKSKTLPAKRVVKFRIAKAAKDAILNSK